MDKSKSFNPYIQGSAGEGIHCLIMASDLKLSWTGDFKSFKEFIELYASIEGTWESPGGERKTYSDGNTTITWWKNKKKMEFSGDKATK